MDLEHAAIALINDDGLLWEVGIAEDPHHLNYISRWASAQHGARNKVSTVALHQLTDPLTDLFWWWQLQSGRACVATKCRRGAWLEERATRPTGVGSAANILARRQTESRRYGCCHFCCSVGQITQLSASVFVIFL